MRNLLLALVFVLLPFTDAFGERSLTTTFVSNNSLTSSGNGTIFFDIENLTPLDINIISWDINIECGPGTTLEVYYREGPIEGFTNTLDGWMLLGQIDNLDCAGRDNPTPLAIGGLIIEPGQIKGFAMVEINPNMSEGIWWYTNGTGSNEVYNNGDIELVTDTVSGNFPGFPSPDVRVWNGTVFYELVAPVRNVPTLSEWGLIAMAGLLGIACIMVLSRKKVRV